MIAGLIGRLVGSPWGLAAAALAAVALVGAIYGAGYRHADANGRADIAELKLEHAAALQAEKDRQNEANNRALQEANERIKELEDKRDETDGLLEELGIAAGDDAHADRVCLSADSVRRIRSVTGR